MNTSVQDIHRFSKSGIPIYNSEVMDTADRKARRKKKRTKPEIAKRYAFPVDAESVCA